LQRGATLSVYDSAPVRQHITRFAAANTGALRPPARAAHAKLFAESHHRAHRRAAHACTRTPNSLQTRTTARTGALRRDTLDQVLITDDERARTARGAGTGCNTGAERAQPWSTTRGAKRRMTTTHTPPLSTHSHELRARCTKQTNKT